MKVIQVQKAASKGIAIGKAFVAPKLDLSVCEDRISAQDVITEKERFTCALAKAAEEIEALSEQSPIFAAHLEVADDPTLSEGVLEKIEQDYFGAECALVKATEDICALFESLDDEYLKERAIDIQDVSKRILCILKGVSLDVFSTIKEPTIIIAEELTPSDTANMDFAFVKGFVTARGGVTSHVAIIARQRSLPAFVGVSDILTSVTNGEDVIVNAVENTLTIAPDSDAMEQATLAIAQYQAQMALFEAGKHLPAQTKDEHRVLLAANVGNLEDIEGALAQGVTEIGLFRTEFLYMENQKFPTEEEQFAIYRAAAEKVSGGVIVRTLDIGGDKSLPYYTFDAEENPFLGWRAIRISLTLQEVFKTQLRALLRASVFGDIRIMYPMIISVEELREANKLLTSCKEELRTEGFAFNEDILAGVMIETPAAVLIAQELAKEADFFSIGTNDLTQYLLAVDRGNEKIAHLYDSFHPAVLRAIRTVIEAGHSAGISVGMCGEFASDEKALPVFLGLGLDEFSMAGTAIAQTRYAVRNLLFSEAQILANSVLGKATIADVMDAICL